MSSDVEMDEPIDPLVERADYERREVAERAFRADLRAKGHRCIRCHETYPSTTGWCKQPVCIYAQPEET